MNCERVTRLLALEDAEAAPEPRALRDHLSRCAACAARHPEVGPLLEARPAPAGAPRRRLRLLATTEIPWRTAGRVAAAALFVVGVVLGPHSQPVSPEVVPSATQAEEGAASGGAIPFRPAVRREEVTTTTTVHRGRRIRSSLTRVVVVPDRPRILEDR